MVPLGFSALLALDFSDSDYVTHVTVQNLNTVLFIFDVLITFNEISAIFVSRISAIRIMIERYEKVYVP